MAGESTDSEKPTGGAVQSVDRALQVLEMIGRAGSAGVTELAEELGVHKSTVSRIIGSLESRGFVEQAHGGRKYRIGFTVVRLAGTTTATLDLAKFGQELCNTLAEDTGETTNLAILRQGEAINVVEAQGSSSVALNTWVGQASPAHATSSGKALLSGLTDPQLRKSLPRTLPRFTEKTITDLPALIDELHIVAERGWSLADEELEVGLVAMAVPIRDHTGQVVAALSVSGPRYRFDPADAHELVAKLTVVGDELNAKFGYHG